MSIWIGCTGMPPEAAQIKKVGFDYLEVNITALVQAEEEEFSRWQRQLKACGLPVRAGNCFLPGDWPLSREGFDPQENRRYIEKAACRLHKLGAQIAVLGSGGARRLSQAYGIERGKRQFSLFFHMASAIMGEKGIRVVIEPLNRQETNFIHSIEEAMAVVRETEVPFGGVLCDYYHVGQEHQNPDLLLLAGEKLWHCHIAHPVTRMAPREGDGGGYESFAAALRKNGYSGGVTFEGIMPETEEEWKASCQYLKTLFSQKEPL